MYVLDELEVYYRLDKTPCSLVEIYGRCRGKYCLYFQSQSRKWTKKTSSKRSVYLLPHLSLRP
jgi:hypothetical protein